MEEKKVQNTSQYKQKDQRSELSSARYGSSEQRIDEFISHDFPHQEEIQMPTKFEVQGDPTENLKDLDAQLEKLQMEILMSSFNKESKEEIKQSQSIAQSILSANATQGTASNPQSQRADDLNIKDFLFSFRNGDEKVNPQTNTSRESSVGFLDQVQVQTQSDEEDIRSFKSESERQSRNNYGEELQVIQEDAQEMYGTVSGSNPESSHRQSSDFQHGSIGSTRGQGKSWEDNQRQKRDLGKTDGSFGTTPSEILIKFKEEKIRNRPMTRQSPPRNFFEENKPMYIEEEKVNFADISQIWANQVEENDQMKGAFTIRDCDAPSSSRSSNIDVTSRTSSKRSGTQIPLQKPKQEYVKSNPSDDNSELTLGGARQNSQKSQDYVKIFETLLERALVQQNDFLLIIGDVDFSDIMIDPIQTKSFKELSVKMMQQNKFLIDFTKQQKGISQQALSKLKNLQIQYDQSRNQMKELYESHIQESQLQEQIMEAKINGMQEIYGSQIKDLKNQLNSKDQQLQNQNGQLKQMEYKQNTEIKEKDNLINHQKQLIIQLEAKADNLGKQGQNQIVELAKKYGSKVSQLQSMQQAQIQSQSNLKILLQQKQEEIDQLQFDLQSKPKSNAAILLELEKKVLQLKNELQQVNNKNQDFKNENERIQEENNDLSELVAILKQQDESSSNVSNLNSMKIEKIQKIVQNQQIQLEQRDEVIQNQDQNLESMEEQLNDLKDQIENATSQNEKVMNETDQINKLYNQEKKISQNQIKEIEELKIKYQDQIKENLDVESKLKMETDEKIKEINAEKEKSKHIEKQLENMKVQIQNIKDDFDLKNKKLQEQYKSSSEENQSLAWDYKQKLDTANHEIRKSNQEVQNRKIEIQEYRDRIKQIQQMNDISSEKEQQYQNQIIAVKQKNGDLQDQLRQYLERTDNLEGVDISIVLMKDRDGGYSDTITGIPKPTKGGARSHKNGYIDMANSYGNQFEGVTKYAQAVCQVKLIDKFIKMDRQQKIEINKLKSSLKVIEREAIQNTQEIIKVQEEKSSLEALILEILSFGEQCDKQFDQLQLNFQKFDATDKAQNEKMIKGYGKIKLSLNESIKNTIIEIEDSSVRDDLLGILTKLNTNTIELDHANTQMINNLVVKLRDSLQKNKDLHLKMSVIQVRDDEAREAEIQQDLIKNQLKEQQQVNQTANEFIYKASLISKEIMRHVDSIISVKNIDLESPDKKKTNDNNDSFREPTREDKTNKDKQNREEIKHQLLQDLRSLTDWIHDQKALIPRNIANQNKMIELNLKINNLINENSLLQVLNEKHKIIVAKYRKSFRLKSGNSPLRVLEESNHNKKNTWTQIDNQHPKQEEHYNYIQDGQNDQDEYGQEYGQEEYDQEFDNSQQNNNYAQDQDSQLKTILSKMSNLKQEAGQPRNMYYQNGSQNVEYLEQSKGTDSSYYDHRGSFDLVNQSRVEKMSNQYKIDSFDNPREIDQYQSIETIQGNHRPIKVIEEESESSFNQHQNFVMFQSQMANTIHEDQLVSYRRASMQDNLNGTSTFVPTFANTENPSNLYTARNNNEPEAPRVTRQMTYQNSVPVTNRTKPSQKRYNSSFDSNLDNGQESVDTFDDKLQYIQVRSNSHSRISDKEYVPLRSNSRSRSKSGHRSEKIKENRASQNSDFPNNLDQTPIPQSYFLTPIDHSHQPSTISNQQDMDPENQNSYVVSSAAPQENLEHHQKSQQLVHVDDFSLDAPRGRQNNNKSCQNIQHTGLVPQMIPESNDTYQSFSINPQYQPPSNKNSIPDNFTPIYNKYQKLKQQTDQIHNQQRDRENKKHQERQQAFERERQLQNEKIEHINDLLKKQNELLAMAETSGQGQRTNHSTIIYPLESSTRDENFSNNRLSNYNLQDERNLKKQKSVQEMRQQKNRRMDSYERSRASLLKHEQSIPYLPSSTTIGDSLGQNENRQNYNSVNVTRRIQDQDKITYSLKKPDFVKFQNENCNESLDSLQYTPIRYMTPLPQDEIVDHKNTKQNQRADMPFRDLNTLQFEKQSSHKIQNPHQIPNQMSTHQVPQEKYQELNHYQSRNTATSEKLFNPLEDRLPNHMQPLESAMVPLRKKSRQSKSKPRNDSSQI